MASEIQINGVLKVTKDSAGIADSIALPTTKPTMSGTERIDTIVSIGTSEEALPMNADSTVPGWCYIENLDDTNYVSVRAGTGLANFLELKPGEGCFFRIARTATAPYAIANTAACRVRWVVYED